MLATWSYKERDTFIQRLDPRSRVIFMIATMFATIPIWDLRLVLIPFALTIAELILARISWSELRRFVLFVSAFVTFLTLLTLLTGRGGTGVYTIEHVIWQRRVLGLPIVISAERLALAATQLLRLFTMALLGIVLLLTIHPAGYGVTFRRLGLPDNVACALDLAVRFVPSLDSDFTTTLDAQRARLRAGARRRAAQGHPQPSTAGCANYDRRDSEGRRCDRRDESACLWYRPAHLAARAALQCARLRGDRAGRGYAAWRARAAAGRRGRAVGSGFPASVMSAKLCGLNS
ncbi:MAG: energy-coupling factor transporter transmembrane protein EcfT, partial [Chloroflexota bacterium]|nr:energy-coupling factor transporter transmembrane protein EcfT [Chloroflexota bacterium]